MASPSRPRSVMTPLKGAHSNWLWKLLSMTALPWSARATTITTIKCMFSLLSYICEWRHTQAFWQLSIQYMISHVETIFFVIFLCFSQFLPNCPGCQIHMFPLSTTIAIATVDSFYYRYWLLRITNFHNKEQLLDLHFVAACLLPRSLWNTKAFVFSTRSNRYLSVRLFSFSLHHL